MSTELMKRQAAPQRGAARYLVPMDIDKLVLDDPGKIPADRAKIADDTLISVSVWAALQGVKVQSVLSNRVKSESRRREGSPKPGDMPKEDTTLGRSPYWRMGTYLGWQASRPGSGTGGGRPKGTGKKIGPRKVALPFDCPHCGHQITSSDMTESDADASGLPVS